MNHLQLRPLLSAYKIAYCIHWFNSVRKLVCDSKDGKTRGSARLNLHVDAVFSQLTTKN